MGSKRGNMKTITWGLGILCVLLVLLGGHESSGAIPFRGKKICYMKLYPSNEFRGKHLTVKRKMRSLLHSERSLRTLGDCCWKVYQKPRYGGRHTTIRGNENLSSPKRWNWRQGQIRSVRRTNC